MIARRREEEEKERQQRIEEEQKKQMEEAMKSQKQVRYDRLHLHLHSIDMALWMNPIVPNYCRQRWRRKRKKKSSKQR